MTTQPPRAHLSTIAAAVAALLLSACGSGGGSTTSGAAPAGVTRGTVTAKDAGAQKITVNGVVLSAAGATVRVDDNPGGLDDVKPGDVVVVKGNFDDRLGNAAEIEVEHGVEGQVDDKGTDFIVVGGARVQVDDSTHFDDRLPAGLDSIVVGSTVVRISGSPVAPGGLDDKGGLRASRVDRSPRHDDASSSNDDDLDVKGFVSALDTSAKTFQLRLSPDATAYYVVDYGTNAVALPAGVQNGSYVEVHTLSKPAGTPPVIVASGIHLEDAIAGGHVEIEGYVTSIAVAPSVSGNGSFVAGGVQVQTSASTAWRLGVPGDLVLGAKVEVEGSMASGALVARRVSFRPGVRITAVVQSYTGSSMTLLGILVQLPSWLENDVGTLTSGVTKIELRGNPAADGSGVVGYRIKNPSGNDDRVFIRAIADAKSAERYLTVLGFTVDTAGASFHDSETSASMTRSQFFAAIEAGHTVVKVRANAASDVDAGARTWLADEVELEGNDD